MMNKAIKNLLAEIERAKKEAITEWMTTKDKFTRTRRSGEAYAFEFVIDRLKSILAAMEDE